MKYTSVSSIVWTVGELATSWKDDSSLNGEADSSVLGEADGGAGVAKALAISNVLTSSAASCDAVRGGGESSVYIKTPPRPKVRVMRPAAKKRISLLSDCSTPVDNEGLRVFSFSDGLS